MERRLTKTEIDHRLEELAGKILKDTAAPEEQTEFYKLQSLRRDKLFVPRWVSPRHGSFAGKRRFKISA